MNMKNKQLIQHVIKGSKKRRRRKREHDLSKSKALENVDFLSLLGKTKNKRSRLLLLEMANKPQIDAILECIQNVNQGNVPIKSDRTIRQLKRYGKMVRQLNERGSNLQKKKTILQEQAGAGFFAPLIPLAINALSSLFGK